MSSSLACIVVCIWIYIGCIVKRMYSWRVFNKQPSACCAAFTITFGLKITTNYGCNCAISLPMLPRLALNTAVCPSSTHSKPQLAAQSPFESHTGSLPLHTHHAEMNRNSDTLHPSTNLIKYSIRHCWQALARGLAAAEWPRRGAAGGVRGQNPCPDLGTKAEGEDTATMSAVSCGVGRGWVAVVMVALAAAAARQ